MVQQRVTITCDLNTPTGVEQRELPFVVLIVADVAGESQPTDKPSRGDGQLHTVDRKRFDDALAAVQPQLTLKDIVGLGAVPLRFNRMADFTPRGIVEQIAALWKRLRQRREVEWQWRRSHAPVEAPCPELTPLDDALSESVSAILHDADFQRLEATWRGIHHLVCGSPPSDAVVFRLMDLNRAELMPALATGVDGSRGVLAQTVLGAAATNAPFGVVMADWTFGHDAGSVACLQRMAAIGAEAHVPIIAAADCTAFGLDRQVLHDFEGANFIDWAEFRQSEDARYVGLAVPRVLMRLPYGDGGEAVDGFDCQERIWPEPAADAADAAVAAGQALRQPQLDRLLWGNAAFVLAGRLVSPTAI
jgi:type VI secretion system ImpC/EvpB family protein